MAPAGTQCHSASYPISASPPENLIQPSSAKGWDVLDEAPARPRLGDNPVKLEPEPGSFAAEADSAPGNTDVLTREAASDDVNAAESRVIASEFPHVAVNRNVGPMAIENRDREVGLFAERHRAKAGFAVRVSRFVQAKADASDAAEQVEDVEHGFLGRGFVDVSVSDTRSARNDYQAKPSAFRASSRSRFGNPSNILPDRPATRSRSASMAEAENVTAPSL
jgi:hypothetical protein